MKKLIVLFAVVICSTISFASTSCEMPKFHLENGISYVCVSPDYQPVWVVVYWGGQLVVVSVSNDFEVANSIPVVFRAQSMNFASTQTNKLRVWLTKDAKGEWIRMKGTN